jgi:hypothetical protein
MTHCTDQIVGAVANIGGGACKSTFSRNGLASLIPKAILVSVEDWNSSQVNADLEISSSKFFDFAAQLNCDDESDYILDIGASNSKQMFEHFNVLTSTLQRITHWIVPTRVGIKQRVDTLKTIQLLLKLDVDPSTVTVVGQAILDVQSFDKDFSEIVAASKEYGFKFCDQAVLHTPIFELIKGSGQSVFDIVNAKPDFRELRRAAEGDEKRLMQVGHQMLVTDLATAAARNYLGVFESLDIGRQIYARG